MSKVLNKIILEAHKRGFQRVFETAVCTGTSLIFSQDGKIVEIKPPYRYKLVRIKETKKNKKK